MEPLGNLDKGSMAGSGGSVMSPGPHQGSSVASGQFFYQMPTPSPSGDSGVMSPMTPMSNCTAGGLNSSPEHNNFPSNENPPCSSAQDPVKLNQGCYEAPSANMISSLASPQHCCCQTSNNWFSAQSDCRRVRDFFFAHTSFSLVQLILKMTICLCF